MALETPSQSSFDFAARVANAYASLAETSLADPESALGGKLFYAGGLDDEARAIIVAANIAGAATLAATADRELQKQALRDGVADFAVTTLDEALRILKNQLRKRETVAVCVGQPPAELEEEMNERGVAPDLRGNEIHLAPSHDPLARGGDEEQQVELNKIPALVTWQTAPSLPRNLAALDEIALSCLDPDDSKSHRWLRLAPRYLGRMAGDLRLLASNREFAARFWEQLEARIDRSDITFAFEICSYFRGTLNQFRFDPSQTLPAERS